MAEQFDLKALLDALIYAESGGDPMAVSKKGAAGLTQLMPETAMNPRDDVRNIFDRAEERGYPVTERTPAAAQGLLFEPDLSYLMGDDYLRAMLDLTGGDMDRALAAYNWGPTNALRWNGKFEDLPEQSRDYIPKIRAKYEELTGSALPAIGTYGTQRVTSPRPQRRPTGLLAMR
jgi:soluble lytic murein transglycosylase-like protein